MFFMKRRGLASYLLLLSFLIGSLWLSRWASGAAAVATSGPAESMGRALKSYQRGAFEEAAAGWTEAARMYEQAGKPKEQSEALIFLAQAYRSMGHYTKALQSLQSASNLIERAGDRSRLARIKGLAGALYLASGQPEDAARSLNEGLQLAREAGNTGLTAVILNDKGNWLASKKKHDEAIAQYTKTLSLAQATRNQPLWWQSLANPPPGSL